MPSFFHIVAAGLLGFMCLAECAFAQPVRLYVSPEGDDSATGEFERPFTSLLRARDEIRALRSTGQLSDEAEVEIIVNQGVYQLETSFQLTSVDSGTPDAPIVYRAAPDAIVRLVGGQVVPDDAFHPISDSELEARIKPAAREHVRVADLMSLGISELPAYPATFRGAPAVPELFFDDRRMQVAQWPNEGWAEIARIIDSGSIPRHGDTSGRPGIFEYTEDALSTWDVANGVWLNGYWCFDWHEETIRVAKIDPDERRITMAEPAFYGVQQGNPSPRRYRALNVLEELDTPGEYYLDIAEKRLLFWPPDAVDEMFCVLSTLNEPLILFDGVSHVRWQGFVVEASLADGIAISGGADVAIQGCTIRNTRQVGVRVEGGTNHRVESCDVYATGTGGISLTGGDRKSLTPSGHQVINCHIHNFSALQRTSANALLLIGVGHRGAHNLIHDGPHQAVNVQGNENVFEMNVVHNVAMETDDCGAYYKGRNPSCRGNIIRHNFWYDIGSPMGHGNAAVYFDDGDGGDTVYGNVFLRSGEPGNGPFGTVFSHGGHGLVADNNIFIDCKRALGSSPWDDERWADALKGFTRMMLEEVDITKPPYTTHYPEIAGFLDYQPGTPRYSTAARNVFVRTGEVSGGNWQVPTDENLFLNHDPGFVDMDGGDFTLRKDSEVFELLPGFEPIPFSEMGLYLDEFRTGLP